MMTLYRTDAFNQWLRRLKDREAVRRIAICLARMELGNLGDVKAVGEGISEARIHYGAGYRLYFIRRGKEVIVMLGGGDKSSQPRDIAKAKELAKRYR
jgi:putative addiction module killer protein